MFRKKDIPDVNYLEITPCRILEHTVEENGLVSVLIPRFYNKILVRIITPMLKSPFVKAKLDEFGSQVWLSIDGERKVASVINTLEEKFGEKAESAQERVIKFLTQLYAYKLISFKEFIKQ